MWLASREFLHRHPKQFYVDLRESLIAFGPSAADVMERGWAEILR
jgi:hypothetical protein